MLWTGQQIKTDIQKAWRLSYILKRANAYLSSRLILLEWLDHNSRLRDDFILSKILPMTYLPLSPSPPPPYKNIKEPTVNTRGARQESRWVKKIREQNARNNSFLLVGS